MGLSGRSRAGGVLIHLVLLGIGVPTLADDELEGRWVVGVQVGELPVHGSFKFGVHVGYHVDEHVYLGIAAQIPDRIARDETSFNARAIGLEGLTSSRETVGPRGYLEARIRPHRYAPFLSTGICMNGTDTETIGFDDRSRRIGDGAYEGSLTVVQTRRAGVRPALGAGYAVTLDSGLAFHTGWAGWWLRGAPEPRVEVTGVTLAPGDEQALVGPIVRRFRASPFNTYHVFQLGMGRTLD